MDITRKSKSLSSHHSTGSTIASRKRAALRTWHVSTTPSGKKQLITTRGTARNAAQSYMAQHDVDRAYVRDSSVLNGKATEFIRGDFYPGTNLREVTAGKNVYTSSHRKSTKPAATRKTRANKLTKSAKARLSIARRRIAAFKAAGAIPDSGRSHFSSIHIRNNY